MMLKAYRITIISMLVIGSIALVIAYALIRREDSFEAIPVDVGPGHITFDTNQPGEYEFNIQVTNQNNSARRIIGIESMCGNHCCVSSKYDGPITVPPHSTVDYVCILRVHSPGPFLLESVP